MDLLRSMKNSLKNRESCAIVYIPSKCSKGELIAEDEEEISAIEWVDRTISNERFPFYDGGFEALLEVAIPYKFQPETK